MTQLGRSRKTAYTPFMRVLLALLVFLVSVPGNAQTALQPLIDAASPNAIIALPDGEYDDATPVYIRKDVTLSGSRNAIVHSEFQITGGVVVRFNGFTLDMNKVGAPARNGVTNVYPQNGMVVVMGGSTLWADDLEVHLQPGLTGYALQKNAFHVVGAMLQLRAVTQFSRVDWRNSPYQVIELLYGSYANLFSVTGDVSNSPLNIVSGTSATGSPLGSGAAAIQIAGSKLTMSGANLFNFGTATMGVYAMRDSYVQIGAGVYTTVQNFGVDAVLTDPSSRKYIAPGNVVN